MSKRVKEYCTKNMLNYSDRINSVIEECLTQLANMAPALNVSEHSLKGSVNMIRKQMQVTYDLWAQSCCGMAVRTYRNYTLRINPYYLVAYGEDYMSTVRHEMAHIACYELYRGRNVGHGKEWKQLDRAFGNQGHRLESYMKWDYAINKCAAKLQDSENFHPLMRSAASRVTSSPITFSAKCDCMEHTISKRKYNNITLRGVTYVCKKCKGTLVP